MGSWDAHASKNEPKDHENEPKEYKNEPKDHENEPKEYKNEPKDHENEPKEFKNEPKDHENEPKEYKQVQICAEGCEEDNITHFFWIKFRHKLCTLIDKTQLWNMCNTHNFKFLWDMIHS